MAVMQTSFLTVIKEIVNNPSLADESVSLDAYWLVYRFTKNSTIYLVISNPVLSLTSA